MMDLTNKLDQKEVDEKNLQELFYKFRKSYSLYSKRYNLDDGSYDDLCNLQDKLFKDMTKTKFTNSYQKWNPDDDYCLLKMWNSGTSVRVIERVLNRSEKACSSRVSRLRHDKLLESIPTFFDELSARLDVDPRMLQNAVDVILDNKKYEEFKRRADVNVSKT